MIDKRMKLKHVILALFLLSGFTSKGQITEVEYYSDELVGLIDHVYQAIPVSDGIIIAGSSLSNEPFYHPYKPIVVKIDLFGQLVWSTGYLTQMGSAQYSPKLKIWRLDDGGIYCDWQANAIFSLPDITYLFRIDESNGNVDWTWNYPALAEYEGLDLDGYDENSIVVLFERPTGTNNFYLLNRFTGSIIQSNGVPYGPPSTNVKVDANKNVYFTSGGTLVKHNLLDMDQVIWSRSDYEYGSWPDNQILLDIEKLYIDRYGDIYLFGEGEVNGNWWTRHVAKVDANTGELIWMTYVGGYGIRDFADKYDHLNVQMIQTTVGGGTYPWGACKIDKITGELVWYASHNLVPGSNNSGGVSIDVDCQQNVYSTGYTYGGGWGNGEWTTLKLDGNNGDLLFDHTLTENTDTIDNSSMGIDIFAYGTRPLMVGNYQIEPYSAKAVFAELTPNGQLVHKKFIGSEFTVYSRTLDIQKHDDEIYVLKQIGRTVGLTAYDSDGSQIWESIFQDEHMMLGCQMVLGDTSLYFTTTTLQDDAETPYFQSNSHKLSLRHINMEDGQLTHADSLTYPSQNVNLLELEGNDSAVFVFFKKDDMVMVRKWNSFGFSDQFELEAASINTTYDGELNFVTDVDGNRLLVAGKDSVYYLNKQTMQTSAVFNFPSQRSYHDVLSSGDTLVMAGVSSSGAQLITVIDVADSSLIWEEFYANSGEIYKVKQIGAALYALGVAGNEFTVDMISLADGSVVWNNTDNPTNGQSIEAYDLVVNEAEGYVLFAGSTIYTATHSDGVIQVLGTDGSAQQLELVVDGLELQSLAYSTELLNDTVVWIGGSQNSIIGGKEGFIFSMSPEIVIVPDDTTGIDDVNARNHSLKVVPNPTNGSVSIFGLERGSYSYSITDMAGGVRATAANVTERSLDFTRFASGMYLLTVEQNKKMYQVKIVRY